MATFYILYSKTIDKFYTGFTDDDISNRIKKHLTNHKGFTAKAKDWKLVYSEEFNDKKEAYARERMIKGWKSRKKIEHLISLKKD